MLTTVAEIRAMLREADETELAALERSLAADTRKGVREALSVARKRVDAAKQEQERVAALYDFERSLASFEGEPIIVGLDEVGRGSLAGPLAVGAVVLPKTPHIMGLNDSKQVKPENRARIADEIGQCAIACAVQYVTPSDIDRFGMSTSLRRAFAGALSQIEAQGVVPDVVLVDGNPLHVDEREISVVKGDTKCASIAAASILAKARRDALMCELAPDYPLYAFDENKGYSSPHHIKAIKTYGLSDMHRRSFCASFLQESLF